MQGNKTVEVFCSYAPDDEIWFHKLNTHWSLSRQQGLFTLWHQQLISPGNDKQQAIATHLETADVILLLVSADFLASDECLLEMKQALERQQRDEARVIPILIREAAWEYAPFAHLHVLPTNAKPLAQWEDTDAALTHVARKLRDVIEGKPLPGPGDTHDNRRPYKGLLPYREEDAAFFFGREAYLKDLLDLLREERRFLLLLGPNSSGQTSLVQAGLIPLLRRHGLSGAIFEDIVTYTPQKPLLETVMAFPVFYAASTLPEGLLRWKSNHPYPARLIFIIDTLEELFHCADESERRQFIDQLVMAIEYDLATIILDIQRTASYTRLVASTDGSQLVASGETGLIWIQHAYEEEARFDIFPEFTQIRALALSSDGTSVVLLRNDIREHDAWIIDLFRIQPPKRLSHSEAVVNVLCCDNKAITVTESGKILCWSLADASLQHRLSHPDLTAVSMIFDERYLATASRNGTAKLWDLVRGTCISTFDHEQTVNVVAFHPEQTLLATATESTIYIWDWGMEEHRSMFQRQRKVKAYFEVASPIVALSFGGNILVASDKKIFHLWNIDANQPFFSYELRTPLQTLQVHPGGHLLATAEEDGTVFLWDLTRTKPAPIAILPHPGSVQSLCFHPYKPYLATASRRGGVRLWQYGVSKQLTLLEYPGMIEEMEFYQQEGVSRLQVIIKESEASRRQVWSFAPGDVVLSMPLQERAITASGMSLHMFSTSNIEELLKGRESDKAVLYMLKRLTQAQKALFSPTGRYIITISADFTVHIWEAATGHPLAELEHNDEVYRLALSADETHLATASRDQHIRIWHWSSDVLFQEARYHMTRNLTPEEWLHYLGDIPYEETFLLDWWADERTLDL